MTDVSMVEDSFAQGFRGDHAPTDAPDRTAEIDAAKEAVAAKYPALTPHLADAAVQFGDRKVYEKTGNHLEFFPAWESENPNPGKTTLEIYDHSLKGKELEDAIAGDMLHHLSSVHPETQQPIDAKWRGMRDEVIAGRDATSKAMDESAYASAVRNGETRDFDQWMDNSRADAHLRGYITPDKANNWRDAYTPAQKAKLEEMKAYLSTERDVGDSEIARRKLLVAPNTWNIAAPTGLINRTAP